MLPLSRTRRAAPQSADRMPEPKRRTYRAVLGSPYTARLLFGTLLGRLPSAMGPVAILLSVTASGGGYARAGSLAALQGLAAAIGQPLLGRQVDRHGQRRILTISTATATLAWVLLGVVGPRHLLAAASLALLTGISAPPLQSSLRTLWPSLLPDGSLLTTALALDSASAELIYIGGPLIATATAFALGPTAALGLTAAIGPIGTAFVVTAAPTRRLAIRDRQRHWLGALRTPGLRRLCPAMAAVGVAIGAVPVSALIASRQLHDHLLVGTIPAAFAGGALVGGVVFGLRPWRGTLTTQLLCVAMAFSVSWIPLLLSATPTEAVIAAFLPGLWLTPVLTCSMVHVTHLVDQQMQTEAYAWLIAAIGAGESLGAVAAGACGAYLPGTLWPLLGSASALLLLAAFHKQLRSTTTPSTQYTTPPHALQRA